MSPAIEILSELQARGVTVRVDGDMLKMKPAGALDEILLERVRAHKAEVLAALRGKRMPIPTVECAHCNGAGVCNCPACNLRRTTEAVPCLMCHSAERQLWLGAHRPKGCRHCSGTGNCTCISCKGICGTCRGTGEATVWLQ